MIYRVSEKIIFSPKVRKYTLIYRNRIAGRSISFTLGIAKMFLNRKYHFFLRINIYKFNVNKSISSGKFYFDSTPYCLAFK